MIGKTGKTLQRLQERELEFKQSKKSTRCYFFAGNPTIHLHLSILIFNFLI